MLILESLPTVIGTAAVAPALLILWLVVAADERPGPPAKVWTAFLLGAASISLLGLLRAPFLSLLTAPENPWVAQATAFAVRGRPARGSRQDPGHCRGFGTARRFADPMDTVVYGAAAGLGFAAYENLAYLVQHAEMWQSLAALRSVLTVPFHGALGDHRRRLSGDRAIRHRARRAPASPRLGAHLKPDPGPGGTGGAACGVSIFRC